MLRTPSALKSLCDIVLITCATVSVGLTGCSSCRRSQQTQTAPQRPVDLQLAVSVPFRFVVYGDTRFTDPNNTEASSAAVRRTLVQAIADVHPSFISIGGDIAYNGNDVNDWTVWDSETSAWRENKIPIYPALGNHDLHGDQKVALANYFQRFPGLKNSRYYSVRVANTLILILDSSIDENSGPQGQWLMQKLDTIPADVDFVCLVLHHPPYTSSSDEKKYGGGHSARKPEHLLAEMLETRQQNMHARIVVFAGHVHNYERHEHGGVTYLVTGGGGAHAYPIERAPDDPFRDKHINYHYLLVEVDHGKLKITMNRVDLSTGKAVWTQPDGVNIVAPTVVSAKAATALNHPPPGVAPTGNIAQNAPLRHGS
jgi:acid phosphatase type 7